MDINKNCYSYAPMIDDCKNLMNQIVVHLQQDFVIQDTSCRVVLTFIYDLIGLGCNRLCFYDNITLVVYLTNFPITKIIIVIILFAKFMVYNKKISQDSQLKLSQLVLSPMQLSQPKVLLFFYQLLENNFQEKYGPLFSRIFTFKKKKKKFVKVICCSYQYIIKMILFMSLIKIILYYVNHNLSY